jgi:hypothetical protein
VLTAQLDHGATVVPADDAVIRYHLASDRAARRRRAFRQQRGHALIARRIGARRDGTTTTFTVRRRILGAVIHVVGAITGRRGPRAAHVDGFMTECVAIGWLVRFSLRCPPPRRADPAVRDRYVVLAAPAAAGSAVSKIRSDPSP